MRHRTAVPAVLALLVWFSCSWFGSWEFNPNNATRLFAAISLVEDGDATIDEFAELTIDKAKFDDHVYLDKAPGMTLMAMPAVAIADRWTSDRMRSVTHQTGDPAFARYLRLVLRLAVAMGPALLTGLAAAALFDLAQGTTGGAGGALFAALGYALGSPIWGWSTTVFGHAVVGALYVLALWAIWRATNAAVVRPGLAALAGLALGWAVVVEYQAVLAGAVLGLFALLRWSRVPARWRLTGALVGGGVAGLLPLIAYNLVAFGTPFRLGYQGVVGFEGMDQGLFGLTGPSPAILWQLVFGTRRGLFWVAPVLVLAPLGLRDLVAAQRTRAIGIAAAAGAVVVLLVNAAYVYWDGGNATGPRHAMPAVGLLSIGLAPFWAGLRTTRVRRMAAVVLAGSIAINAIIAGCDIFAAPTDAWPLRWVIREHLARGDVTSIAGDWWGWPKWTGLALWAAVALPMLSWLVHQVGREDQGRRARVPGDTA